ncbi:DUF2341 domain-containing protein [Methanotorris igneus]|uniref:DUF2341 domain-containing protein n=1 Tax=Methanotorris igneus (strain DSM 5666 / JCM 11834 / Kol 5) TaxID=880724 RepID=F6BDE6_METIK|nr:DUF2341 domain-containing protein [Methanotorris igneus]AEF96507.1 Protein of unknown function DUF2341 [Methanotorris igneus Kol 5]
MYLSQTMITLTLLLLLTGTLVYQTIDIHREMVLNEMKASSVDLKSSTVEHVVNVALPKIFNKALNDAELEVIERYNNGAQNPFFNNVSDALNFIKERTENLTNAYLENISEEYSKMGYNFEYTPIKITNITMVDGFTFKINYTFSYNLSKDGVFKTKDVNSYQYCTVKTILDAYHYVLLSGWSLKDWDYRKMIIIHENSGKNLTDYQVLIKLNSSNFNFSKAKSDGSDIRFTYLNTTTNTEKNISYWIEYWNSTSENASIWIKVPYIPANGDAIIYIYYGNSEATNESNGDVVFDYFDNGSKVSTWNVNSSAGENQSDGNPAPSYYAYANSYMYKNVNLTTNKIITFNVKTNGSGDFYFLCNNTGGGQKYTIGLGGNYISGFANTTSWTVGDTPSNGFNAMSDTWYKFGIVINETKATLYYEQTTDSSPELPANTNGMYTISNNGGYIGLAGHNETTWWDNIIIRKYTNPEPTVNISNQTLIYISPSNFVEDSNSPSIIDMLAGKNENTWGYGIKLVE